jgi:hypothetical protein
MVREKRVLQTFCEYTRTATVGLYSLLINYLLMIYRQELRKTWTVAVGGEQT